MRVIAWWSVERAQLRSRSAPGGNSSRVRAAPAPSVKWPSTQKLSAAPAATPPPTTKCQSSRRGASTRKGYSYMNVSPGRMSSVASSVVRAPGPRDSDCRPSCCCIAGRGRGSGPQQLLAPQQAIAAHPPSRSLEP